MGERLVVGFRYKRTESKITFCFLFAFEGILFSKFKPFCTAFVLGALAGYRAQTCGAKSS